MPAKWLPIKSKRNAAGFKEFTDHVQEYVKLHKAVEANLPVLKPTDLPEMITAHQQALARKIREARPRAVVAALLQRAEACSSGVDQGPQTSDHH